MTAHAEIASPCTSVCKLSVVTGYCLGCWRTREEIKAWSAADTRERLTILAQLRERRRAAGVTNERDRRRGRRIRDVSR